MSSDTKTRAFRISKERDEALKILADLHQMSPSEYLRSLIDEASKQHIKRNNGVDPTGYEALLADFSIALATILQITKAQNENTQQQITMQSADLFDNLEKFLKQNKVGL